VQQTHTICRYNNSNSWVILSPIEQKIKEKIEAVGTPLKDWDIQINYGIKTGLNDAFIISIEKREEILSACKSEEEYKKTAELIRPILRGRDIRKYGYEFEKWLINTHNGVKEKTFPELKLKIILQSRLT
jgi:type II restriction/modification system DNA methylase subunit YeeA